MRLKIVTRTSASKSVTDESQLIAAAKSGDNDAFHAIYEQYCDRIYNLIFYTLRNTQEVEDVFQTVFLKVFQALPNFRGDSSFLTWIYQIALNECRNSKRNGRSWTSISEIFASPYERDPAKSPEMIHSEEHRKRQIRLAISRLKPKYRVVVLLKYIEELPYDEVAEILQISPGTIASRLHRALKILESLL